MELRLIKIRFNTNYPESSEYKWRVIEVKNDNWKELLSREVIINTKTYTTTDRLNDGQIKHHITTEAEKLIFYGENGNGFDKIIID